MLFASRPTRRFAHCSATKRYVSLSMLPFFMQWRVGTNYMVTAGWGRCYAKLRIRRRFPSLPLDHLGRHHRVDLQVKVLNADGRIPTVYPPELFGYESTGKFVSFRASTASATIGVNRQIRRVPGVTAAGSLLSISAWYRQLFSVEGWPPLRARSNLTGYAKQ